MILRMKELIRIYAQTSKSYFGHLSMEIYRHEFYICLLWETLQDFVGCILSDKQQRVKKLNCQTRCTMHL